MSRSNSVGAAIRQASESLEAERASALARRSQREGSRGRSTGMGGHDFLNEARSSSSAHGPVGAAALPGIAPGALFTVKIGADGVPYCDLASVGSAPLFSHHRAPVPAEGHSAWGGSSKGGRSKGQRKGKGKGKAEQAGPSDGKGGPASSRHPSPEASVTGEERAVANDHHGLEDLEGKRVAHTHRCDVCDTTFDHCHVIKMGPTGARHSFVTSPSGEVCDECMQVTRLKRVYAIRSPGDLATQLHKWRVLRRAIDRAAAEEAP